MQPSKVFKHSLMNDRSNFVGIGERMVTTSMQLKNLVESITPSHSNNISLAIIDRRDTQTAGVKGGRWPYNDLGLHATTLLSMVHRHGQGVL